MFDFLLQKIQLVLINRFRVVGGNELCARDKDIMRTIRMRQARGNISLQQGLLAHSDTLEQRRSEIIAHKFAPIN